MRAHNSGGGWRKAPMYMPGDVWEGFGRGAVSATRRMVVEIVDSGVSLRDSTLAGCAATIRYMNVPAGQLTPRDGAKILEIHANGWRVWAVGTRGKEAVLLYRDGQDVVH